MKTLYLMRHAHKETTYEGQDDFDIKLSQQGIVVAEKMGEKLNNLEIKPDLIVSSPADRARTTANIIAKKINYDKTIMYNEVLFEAYVNELLETITYTFDTIDSMLLIGHNPSLTAFVISLDVYKEELLPGEVLKIEFDVNSWIDVGRENASFCFIEKPK